MRTRILIIGIFISCALSGCASTGIRRVTLTASGTDQKLIEYQHGFWARHWRFIANGTYVCYEESRRKKGANSDRETELEYQVQYVPSADEWKKFWRAVDGLQLTRWKAKYDQGDIPPPPGVDRVITMDTSDWSLIYSSRDERLRIEGDGAYPVAGRPEQVIDTNSSKRKEKNALEPLEVAFRELAGLPPKP